MQEVKIDKDFAALIPPLTADELAGLETSLIRDGIRDALVVWKETGILLDGHNRFRICGERGIPFRTAEVSLPDRDAAKMWIIDNQNARRNLSDDQRATLALAKKKLLSEIAKRERGKAGRARGGDATPEQIDKRLEAASTPKRLAPRERSRKAAAAEFKTSERKVRQAEQVEKKSPALLKKVRDGEISLAAAVREVKRAEAKAKLAEVAKREVEAPTGKFDAIVIDPPWPMEKIERDVRPNQSEFDYPTMDEKQLAAIKVPCADDCHVWLWTTHKFLPMAFRLLEAWGLKYVCAFVWHKPGGFQPIGLPQYNCEFALYARKGSPRFVDTKKFNVCFEALRGKHSEKPEEFYALLHRVTGGRRLDMFSRRKIDGFIGWGKEA